MRDLDALHETRITIDGHAYVVRSEAKRPVGKVFQACGVAIPPRCGQPRPLGYHRNPEADVSRHEIRGCKCPQAQDVTFDSVQDGLGQRKNRLTRQAPTWTAVKASARGALCASGRKLGRNERRTEDRADVGTEKRSTQDRS